MKPIECLLKNEDPRIIKFFPKVRVKEISETRLRTVDPDLVSFFNVNSPEDLTASEKMLKDDHGISPTTQSIK
jgi:molybdopterin-guanine dinucleotide biosynthesis protein A